MLVLSRRAGESIIIGREVTVTVLEVRGDQIRIGIDAPRKVSVHREEVYLQVAAQNAQAVASADRDVSLLQRKLPEKIQRPSPRR